MLGTAGQFFIKTNGRPLASRHRAPLPTTSQFVVACTDRHQLLPLPTKREEVGMTVEKSFLPFFSYFILIIKK